MIRSHDQALASVTSDEEAVTLFASRLAEALAVPETAMLVTGKSEKSNQEPIGQEVRDAAVQLTAALAAWRVASLLQKPGTDQAAVDQAARQQAWLKTKDAADALDRLLAMRGAAGRSEDSPDYLRYIAQAVRTEAAAERQAYRAWQRLATWRERLQELKGLSRLCGTWQWTVHNHKHHQDHKLVMVFPPPAHNGTIAPGGPAKIVVMGDAVFLRWESEGNVQEDSLLFTGEGRRLEGTFVNSAGSWGSITGKRVGACPTSK